MGESEVVKKLWESNPTDKRKLVILAKLHEVKMQAEICKDHPVSDQDEEAHTATEVSVCLAFYFGCPGLMGAVLPPPKKKANVIVLA